jgi:putative tricarboxylic transport membrane protein
MSQVSFSVQAAFAIFLIVLNTVYASQIPELSMPFSERSEPGPAFLPVVLCLFMYVAGLRILFMELTCTAEEAPAAPDSDTIPFLAQLGPLTVLGLTVCYLIAFPWVGYLGSTVVYSLLISLFFNYEASGDWWDAVWKSALTALSITTFGWLFFVQLFGLYLPVWGG